MQLRVVEAVDYAVVAVSESSEFVNTSDTRIQTVNNTYRTNASTFNFKVMLYSKNDICVNHDNINFRVAVSANNAKLVSATQCNDGSWQFTLDINSALSQTLEDEADRTICVEITSNAVDEQGNPKSFVFYVVKELAGA